MPTSWAMQLAMSMVRAPSASEMRWRYFPRSSMEVCDHVGNAALAAATALSTSAGVPSGMVPITSSVLEFTTSMVPVPVDGIQAPSM